MPPDLKGDYKVQWWRPDSVMSFDSYRADNGQRGIIIPDGYKYVQVRYAQIKSVLIMNLEYNRWKDFAQNGGQPPPRLESNFTAEVPGAWLGGALLACNEVEAMEGIIGYGQNVSNSTFDPLTDNRGGGGPGNVTFMDGYWSSPLNLPSWSNGSVYKIREGYSKLRPYWLVPPKFWVYFYMVQKSEDVPEATTDIQVRSVMEVSSWGSLRPYDGHVALGILSTLDFRQIPAYPFTERIFGEPHEIATYGGYMTIDYLVEFRFYKELSS